MFLSVVMAVHNGETYLPDTLDSLLNQTHPHFEVIAVDDGSTDSTPAILARYAARDSRIRVLQPGKVGLCNALNAGVAAARYDWIARIDADDIALPHRFERQVAVLQAKPHLAALGSYVRHINHAGEVLSEWEFGPVSEADFRRCRLESSIPQIMHPTAIINRALLERIGGYDQAFAETEDLDLFDRLSDHGPVLAVPEPLVHYRVHGGSVTANHYFTQKRHSRYIFARRAAQDRGETLSYTAFLEAQRSAPLLTRFNRTREDRQAFYYRQAGIAYGARHYPRIALFLSLAILLKPRESLLRAWSQVMGPLLRRLLGGDAAAVPEATPAPAPVHAFDAPTQPSRSAVMK